MKHTKGNWRLSTDLKHRYEIKVNTGLGGDRILFQIPCNHASDDKRHAEIKELPESQEQLANAKLVAASPELLAVCELAIKFLDSMATPITGFQQENRRVFRRKVTEALSKAAQ